MLILFSDVNYSPQLISILQELDNHETNFQIVLIGELEAQIVGQIKAFKWKLRVIRKTGKFGSIFHFLVVSVLILRIRPEVVFTSGQFATVIGILSARVFRVPQRIFIRHHSNFHYKYDFKFGILLDHVTNILSTDIVAVSAIVKNILISKEGVSSKKIRLIYNGINLEKFQKIGNVKSKKFSEINEQERLFTIGVISRLTDWKGVEYIATAFVKLQREFPNSRLHIIGAFADSYLDVKNILSILASDTYRLDKSNFNIPLFLHGLDAFIHVPVGIDDEAFGIVYIEALASGIPCIFTQSGVLNELETPDRYAHLVAFRNSDEIYLNLKQLIQGKNESKVAVPESWLNQFSLEEMANRYADLLLGVKR